MVVTAVIAVAPIASASTASAHNVFPDGKNHVRVMTYNIHVGVGMDKKLNLERIANVINRAHPDLVGLQEVDRGVERTQRIDEIALLAQLTRMEYAFAYNLHYQGGQYGVAVLSRFPILALDHRRFDNTREARRRGFIRVEADVRGRRVAFVTTHLDYQHEDGRLFEARQLLDALQQSDIPLVVAGDFNAEPNDSSYKLMLTRFADAWTQSPVSDPKNEDTYPADKPTKRIDYIFTAKESRLRVKQISVVDTQASDHRPLIADLEF